MYKVVNIDEDKYGSVVRTVFTGPTPHVCWNFIKMEAIRQTNSKIPKPITLFCVDRLSEYVDPPLDVRILINSVNERAKRYDDDYVPRL